MLHQLETMCSKDVVIPDNVTKIEESTFEGCSSLIANQNHELYSWLELC